ncbi:hypothetical protein B0H16DRAFT_1857079 [Mycena metata]|uniref:Uncharacterized protein n=1 Tax=Mycena metata TaxID=1033252 RepID=A0AAD7ILF2_9AGAR|nr:hypothetical protein B0H16DRAFT_1857079 [Mycena metata]
MAKGFGKGQNSEQDPQRPLQRPLKGLWPTKAFALWANTGKGGASLQERPSLYVTEVWSWVKRKSVDTKGTPEFPAVPSNTEQWSSVKIRNRHQLSEKMKIPIDAKKYPSCPPSAEGNPTPSWAGAVHFKPAHLPSRSSYLRPAPQTMVPLHAASHQSPPTGPSLSSSSSRPTTFSHIPTERGKTKRKSRGLAKRIGKADDLKTRHYHHRPADMEAAFTSPENKLSLINKKKLRISRKPLWMRGLEVRLLRVKKSF